MRAVCEADMSSAQCVSQRHKHDGSRSQRTTTQGSPLRTVSTCHKMTQLNVCQLSARISHKLPRIEGNRELTTKYQVSRFGRNFCLFINVVDEEITAVH